MKKILGKKVRIISDNENYSEFKDKDLIITHVAYSEDRHPGYDTSLKGQALCDLKTTTGEQVPFSLYEYELKLI